jgi:pimeloyl-ACP methyl ester carboxylesterase
MSVVFLNQAFIHYEALGRGRPVVFLHTWGASWRYWAPSMQALSPSYRSYSLDLYGFGDTARAPDSYSVQGQASLLGAFLDEMGITRTAIIGHGLGAWVGLSLVRRQPDRVARLMAVGAPLGTAALLDQSWAGTPVEVVNWLSDRRPQFQEILAEAAKADPAAVSSSIATVDVDQLSTTLEKADVPCLLVFGDADPSTVVVGATPSPNPVVRRFDLVGAGHFAMLDAPARFHRLLVDFLALEGGLGMGDLQLRDEWKRRVR